MHSSSKRALAEKFEAAFYMLLVKAIFIRSWSQSIRTCVSNVSSETIVLSNKAPSRLRASKMGVAVEYVWNQAFTEMWLILFCLWFKLVLVDWTNAKKTKMRNQTQKHNHNILYLLLKLRRSFYVVNRKIVNRKNK